MIVKSWVVRYEHQEPHRWFWVRVYDTVENLRKGAARYGAEPVGHFDRAVACVQRVWALHSLDDVEHLNPIFPASGFAGVIRLSQENLYTEIIFHELVHAAAIVYRLNVNPDMQLGTGIVADDLDSGSVLANEESLAYIYGSLAADMDTAIREHFDFGNWGK